MIKTSVVKTAPTMAGYIFLGSAFGILAQNQGLPFWVPLAMSLLIYAGAGQFASIPILVEPISLFQTFILALSINARHLFYGISMLKPFSKAGKKKHYMTFALTDESFTLIIKEDDTDLMFNILWLNQVYWILGTAIGYLFGSVIPFDLNGIEFSMTALFLIVFIDKLKDKHYFATFSALIISITCLLVFGYQYFIIPSMIGILLLLSKEAF